MTFRPSLHTGRCKSQLLLHFLIKIQFNIERQGGKKNTSGNASSAVGFCCDQFKQRQNSPEIAKKRKLIFPPRCTLVIKNPATFIITSGARAPGTRQPTEARRKCSMCAVHPICLEVTIIPHGGTSQKNAGNTAVASGLKTTIYTLVIKIYDYHRTWEKQCRGVISCFFCYGSTATRRKLKIVASKKVCSEEICLRSKFACSLIDNYFQ